MSTPVTHPLVGAYLRDLEMLLHGIEPGERAEVLAGVDEHLEVSLGPEASDDDVRRALAELGSPQSVADEAYAGRPAPAAPSPAVPIRRRPSPWLAHVACLVNALMLAVVAMFGLVQPHVMEWFSLLFLFPIPWISLVVLTSMAEVWSSSEKFRSILLIPATIITLGLTTSLITALVGWHDVPLRLTSLAVLAAAVWALVGLVRSANQRTRP